MIKLTLSLMPMLALLALLSLLAFALWEGMEKDLCYRASMGEFTAMEINQMNLTECNKGK